MNIAPLAPVLGSPSASPSSGPAAPATDTFAHILGNFIEHVGQQQAQANQAVRNLALGQTDNLHQVVLQVSQADLAFRLFLEIRNRLSDAYQEVMRMSV